MTSKKISIQEVEKTLKKQKLILAMCLITVLIQLIFTFSDISLREDIRYHKYYGKNILDNLGNQ